MGGWVQEKWVNPTDQAVEEFDLIRVLAKLKPAGTLMTIGFGRIFIVKLSLLVSF